MLSLKLGRKRISGLSKKELETLQYRVMGLDTQEIANVLNRATSTIANHSKKILRKLHARSMPQAVHEAHKRGYLS